MLFTSGWAGAILNPESHSASEGPAIDQVTTNSKQTKSGALFVPIKGERFDGHDFMQEAYDNGAVAALWHRDTARPAFLPEDFPLVYTDDTIDALHKLASAYRDRVDPFVVGVTGSNGKTTTKDMVAAVASAQYNTHYTQGNLNNAIGLPLTVLSMPNNTQVLVLEMGMDHFGEIEQLSYIAQPDIGIITNIGESHIANIGSREGIAKAKLEITKGLKQNGMLIIDGDEPLLMQSDLNCSVTTCGFLPYNDLVVSDVHQMQTETGFRLGHTDNFSIPLLGRHHALNAAFACQVGITLNIGVDLMKQALAELKWTSMRFERIIGKGGAAIINDAYNASPTSTKAAIDVVKAMQGFSNKVLVLGDMLELGERSPQMHRSVVDTIEPEDVTAVFTMGEEARVITETIKRLKPAVNSEHITSKYDMIKALAPYLTQESLILFKASRGMHFESIIENVIDPS